MSSLNLFPSLVVVPVTPHAPRDEAQEGVAHTEERLDVAALDHEIACLEAELAALCKPKEEEAFAQASSEAGGAEPVTSNRGEVQGPLRPPMPRWMRRFAALPLMIYGALAGTSAIGSLSAAINPPPCDWFCFHSLAWAYGVIAAALTVLFVTGTVGLLRGHPWGVRVGQIAHAVVLLFVLPLSFVTFLGLHFGQFFLLLLVGIVSGVGLILLREG